MHRGGTLEVPCGQTVSGDFVIILATPQSEKTSVPICQLPLFSGFVEAGTRKFNTGELDKPVKSLGTEFYLELSVDVCR